MLNNILGNLGNISKLKSMQDALKKQELTHVQDGVSVTVRGDMQLREIKVNGVEQEKILRAVNEALKKIQAESAKSLMAMG